jgi:hypothetical protein
VSLWRHRDFTVFWLGETVSLFGTQVTFVALPMVAVLALDVSAGQLGALRFAEYLPFLAFTLFEVCWLSYVPGLVARDRLVEAMGKVSTSHAVAEATGHGVGGVLVQVLTAPFALVVDGLSYVVCAESSAAPSASAGRCGWAPSAMPRRCSRSCCRRCHACVPCRLSREMHPGSRVNAERQSAPLTSTPRNDTGRTPPATREGQAVIDTPLPTHPPRQGAADLRRVGCAQPPNGGSHSLGADEPHGEVVGAGAGQAVERGGAAG